MPGPVSDSYDPEFTTSSNVEEIRDGLKYAYHRLSEVLDSDPIYILDLIRMDGLNSKKYKHQFTEMELRLFRFAIERALMDL